MLSERNRLALELHDVVSQKLFGLVLTAESAATLFDRDSDAARAQVERLQDLAQEALDELRSLVLELRAPDLERDGLCGALRKHVELQQRLHGVPIELEIDDERDDRRRATARCCGSPRRRCTTPFATPARRGSPSGSPHGLCSRSPTTARASIRPTPSCARATSA